MATGNCTLCCLSIGGEAQHHCRRCGSAVCDACSPHRIQLQEGRPAERVCNACVKVVTLVPQLVAQQKQLGTYLQLAGAPVCTETGSLKELVEANLAASQTLAVMSRRATPESSNATGSPPASPPCEFFKLDEEPQAFDLDGLDSDQVWEDVALDASVSVLDLRPEAEKVPEVRVERVAIAWDGYPRSAWMRPYEALMQLLVQKQVHGCNPQARLRIDFADQEGGEFVESISAAIALLTKRQRGTAQWMWGDVDLPGARFNPMRWSGHRDLTTTCEDLGRYLRGPDARRPIRLNCVESRFCTLEDAISSLQVLSR